MIPTQRLHEILDRFAFVEAKMNETSDPTDIAALGREYANLRGVVETIQAWQTAQTDLEAAEEMQGAPEMAPAWHPALGAGQCSMVAGGGVGGRGSN